MALIQKTFFVLMLVTLPFLVGAQEVEIVWEADSYTPPFYRGKGLYPTSGNVVVSAITTSSSGDVLSTDGLVYQWTKDGVVLGERSGVGVDSLFLEGSTLGREMMLQVLVESGNGARIGEDVVRLRPSDPQLLLYEENPLMGTLFNQSVVGTTWSSQEEVTVGVHPYFFSGVRTTPNYQWRINNRSQSTKSPHVTLRTTEGVNRAQVSLSAQHPTHILQSSFVQTIIRFNND